MKPFRITQPTGAETPVVVEVPHAGLSLFDGETAALCAAPARSIARDADLYVDDLYEDAPAEGATLIVAATSRYVVDLNRAPSDVDADSVEGGGATPMPRGLVWRLSTEGDEALRAPLTTLELERRLTQVYRPYHAALERIVAEKKQRFGYAVVLCAHSMPRRGRVGHGDAGTPRADVVPGTRGRTTASASLIGAVDDVAREARFSVRHDDPYRGGFTTQRWGTPAQLVHAVQVEIARSLYMDEETCRRDTRGFGKVRGFARNLVARLGSTRP